jgi:hypothetical protein
MLKSAPLAMTKQCLRDTVRSEIRKWLEYSRPIVTSSEDIGNTLPLSGPATPISLGFTSAPKPFASLFWTLVAMHNLPVEYR